MSLTFQNHAHSQAMIYWLFVRFHFTSLSSFSFSRSIRKEKNRGKNASKLNQCFVFFFSKSHEYWIMIALVLMMRTNPIFILAAIHIDSNIKCYSTKSVPCICFEFFVYWLYTAAHKLHWNWNKILKTCGTTTFKWCCCCCSTIHIFKINANKVRSTRTHKANNKSILKCDASIVTNARFLFAHIVIRIDVLLFTTPFS